MIPQGRTPLGSVMRKTKIAILHPSLFFSSLKTLCYNDAWKTLTSNFARFGFLCSKNGMKNRDGNWCENRCGNQCENRCENRCENCGKEKSPPFFSARLFFHSATPLAKMRSFFFAAVFAPVSAPLFTSVSAPVFKPVSVAIFHTVILTKKTQHGRNCMRIYDFDSVPKFKPFCECALASSSPNKKKLI